MSVTSEAAATWTGSLIEGEGSVSFSSSHLGTFPLNWKARSRVRDDDHARGAHRRRALLVLQHGALARAGRQRHPRRAREHDRVVTFKPGVGITGSHLNVNASVPGLDAETFQRLAQERWAAPCPPRCRASRSRSRRPWPDPRVSRASSSEARPLAPGPVLRRGPRDRWRAVETAEHLLRESDRGADRGARPSADRPRPAPRPGGTARASPPGSSAAAPYSARRRSASSGSRRPFERRCSGASGIRPRRSACGRGGRPRGRTAARARAPTLRSAASRAGLRPWRSRAPAPTRAAPPRQPTSAMYSTRSAAMTATPIRDPIPPS
jgi:osmotically inducible protein OsmC